MGAIVIVGGFQHLRFACVCVSMQHMLSQLASSTPLLVPCSCQLARISRTGRHRGGSACCDLGHSSGTHIL
eukprot:1498402-Amphidinium_carterae.3